MRSGEALSSQPGVGGNGLVDDLGSAGDASQAFETAVDLVVQGFVF
jgi:hypothetical protein